MGVEWHTFIEVTFETDEVGERRKRVVQDDVEPACVRFVDQRLPLLQRAKMLVEKGQIQWRVLIVGPWQIDEE